MSDSDSSSYNNSDSDTSSGGDTGEFDFNAYSEKVKDKFQNLLSRFPKLKVPLEREEDGYPVSKIDPKIKFGYIENDDGSVIAVTPETIIYRQPNETYFSQNVRGCYSWYRFTDSMKMGNTTKLLTKLLDKHHLLDKYRSLGSYDELKELLTEEVKEVPLVVVTIDEKEKDNFATYCRLFDEDVESSGKWPGDYPYTSRYKSEFTYSWFRDSLERLHFETPETYMFQRHDLQKFVGCGNPTGLMVAAFGSSS